jgi:hypothetical protein
LRYVVASIATTDPAFPQWAAPVIVTIRKRADELDIVGNERPAGVPVRRRH